VWLTISPVAASPKLRHVRCASDGGFFVAQQAQGVLTFAAAQPVEVQPPP
jgi:hypothetical protein